jgi:hypothetical protein
VDKAEALASAGRSAAGHEKLLLELGRAERLDQQVCPWAEALVAQYRAALAEFVTGRA